MKRSREKDDAVWFEKLDAIVTGREVPTSEDDDLLQIAAKLANALSPLNQTEVTDAQNTYISRINIKIQYHSMTREKMKKHSLLQKLLMGAAVLFALFDIVGACPITPQVVVATQYIGQHIWQATTSFEQIDASSLALLAIKKGGVRPLLPTTIPAETQSIEFGIIMDDANPPTFRAFTADYRITGQDVFIYEQATDLVLPSLAAQNVSVNSYQGHLFQDNAGNRILQWYQDGMTCQMASTLPLLELLALARQFHPITRWELIL
jgi:hypothetical protein